MRSMQVTDSVPESLIMNPWTYTSMGESPLYVCPSTEGGGGHAPGWAAPETVLQTQKCPPCSSGAPGILSACCTTEQDKPDGSQKSSARHSCVCTAGSRSGAEAPLRGAWVAPRRGVSLGRPVFPALWVLGLGRLRSAHHQGRATMDEGLQGREVWLGCTTIGERKASTLTVVPGRMPSMSIGHVVNTFTGWLSVPLPTWRLFIFRGLTLGGPSLTPTARPWLCCSLSFSLLPPGRGCGMVYSCTQPLLTLCAVSGIVGGPGRLNRKREKGRVLRPSRRNRCSSSWLAQPRREAWEGPKGCQVPHPRPSAKSRSAWKLK